MKHITHFLHATLLLLPLFLSAPAQAQLRLDFGKDSPLRKLQIAEIAINSFYVDSVDQNKLVEDGIRTKIAQISEESQVKLQDTMQKIVNDSKGRLVCIII